MGITSKQRGKAMFVNGIVAPGYGARNGATVVAGESGIQIFKTILTLTATPITVADTAVGGGVKIYDFPEGRILFLGAIGSLAFTTTSVLASTLNTAVTINWGIGTVITAAQASGTLTTTEQDIIPTTNATASATINVAGAVSNGKSTAVAYFDGTTTPVDAHLNIGVAGATDIDADATLTVAGTITLHWLNLGDY